MAVSDVFIRYKDSATSAARGADKLRGSLSKLSGTTKTIDGNFGRVFKTMQAHNRKFINLSRDVNRSSSAFSGLSKVLAMGGMALRIGLIGKAMSTMIQSAMDMIETLNLFKVALGETADTAGNTLESISTASGMDLTNLQAATGTFALLARSMGFSTEQAELLSTQSTQLAMDFASLMNVPISQALGDIKSGLVGQTETMYKYGVDLTEAALKQEALAEGIDKSVRSMTQGEKMALRYNAMIRQSVLTQGDFARTIESPANQFKILSERVTTCGRAIGSIFLPAISAILPIVNAVVTIITKLANALASLFGFISGTSTAGGTVLGDVAEDADDVAESAGGAGSALKELKNTALGFDELHTVESEASGGGGGGSTEIGSILDSVTLAAYESGLSKIQTKSDEFAKNFMAAFSGIDITNFLESFDLLSGAFDIFNFTMKQGLEWFLTNILVPIATWTVEDALPAFNTMFADILTKISVVLFNFKDTFGYIYDYLVKPVGGAIGSGIVGLFQSIGDWFGDLNFNNLEAPLKNLADNIAPVLLKVLSAIGWVFQNIILPVGKWLIEEFLPVAINVISNAFSLLDGLFNFLAPILEWLWETILKPLGKFLGTILLDVLGDIGQLMQDIGDIFWFIGEAFKAFFDYITTHTIGEDIKALFSGLSEWFNTSVITPISEFFSGLYEDIVQYFVDAWNETVETWNTVAAWFDENVIQPVITWFSTLKENIVTFFTDAWSGVQEVWSTIRDWFQTNVIDALVGDGGVLNDIISGIAGKFQDAWVSVVGIWDGAKQWFIDNVITPISNLFSGLFNKTEFSGGMSVSTSGVGFGVAPQADGGILSMGQLFVAGENGLSETIGNYKGKTTVMPLENTDFVEAIYGAVFAGVSEAQTSGGQIIENILNLDGETIYKNQQKIGTSRGFNFGMGAFAR